MVRDSSGVAHLSDEERAEDLYIMAEKRFYGETERLPDDAAGYWQTRLVDPQDLDLLHFEETGELPEGQDFAVFWNGEWREGRCYDSSPERIFVTYGDAQHIPLRDGMEVRLPLYTLSTERLLAFAQEYARELGYTPTQESTIVGLHTMIASGQFTEVIVPIENGQPMTIVINLSSNGDVRVVSKAEILNTVDLGKEEP